METIMTSSYPGESSEVTEARQLNDEDLELISAGGDPDAGGQFRLHQRAR
jgi:hypothetical protein